jgi:hypothetical protein
MFRHGLIVKEMCKGAIHGNENDPSGLARHRKEDEDKLG